MESIENTTKVRGWDISLSHFFQHGYDKDGLPALRDEIATIQDFLSAAQQQVQDDEAEKRKNEPLE